MKDKIKAWWEKQDKKRQIVIIVVAFIAVAGILSGLAQLVQ